jgi:hypothetical protein
MEEWMYRSRFIDLHISGGLLVSFRLRPLYHRMKKRPVTTTKVRI